MNAIRKSFTKILLIEDDKTYRGLLKDALQKEGVVIISVKDTLAALSIFENDAEIRNVVVDLRMPLGPPNGISFARMARFKRHAIKVVLVSGERELLTVQDAAEFGGVLDKDAGLRTLAARIRERLDLAA